MRGRWIKPETWTSETLSRISRDAVLLFVALWTYADDEGRGLDDPVLIRSTLFPLREDVSDEDVSTWLAELARARLVIRYRAVPVLQGTSPAPRRARPVLQIRSWEEHQSVSHAKPSLYPAPRKGGRRSGTSPERRRSSSVPRSSEVQRREVVEGSGEPLEDDAGRSPNGAGVYDPEAVYVPGPDDPKLFDPDPTPPAEPSSEPRPSPAAWRDPSYNPWSSVPPGKTIADLEDSGS
jgi:hypothetical protein